MMADDGKVTFQIINTTPNADVIETLSELLLEAERGNVQSILAFSETAEGQVLEANAGDTTKSMPGFIGHLELWLLRLKAEHLWQLRELRDLSD